MDRRTRRLGCTPSSYIGFPLAMMPYLALLALTLLVAACGGSGDDGPKVGGPGPGVGGPAVGGPGVGGPGPVVNVANVEDLYAAVNDIANAGAGIVLAPGIYTLSGNGPDGSPRPNGGRLELQPDMSLYGLAGDRSAVVIDTSLLPVSSFTVALGLTGSIRAGRGSHALAWLTILGNPLAAAGIETDLTGTPTTQIRVAHVVSSASLRGVDVRNTGAAMAGRRIDAEIEDSEFSGVGEVAVKFGNLIGAHGGQIYAVMSGNRVYGSKNGCVAVNQRSNFGLIDIRSNGDRFEDNGAGCTIIGATGSGNSNSTTFEAHGSEFVNNTGPIAIDSGGIVALGADSLTGQTNVASNNTVVIRLWDCSLSGNQNTDFEAFGARSTGGIVGTNNTVTIELHGVSKFVDVVATDSLPVEPAGTNMVTVIR